MVGEKVFSGSYLRLPSSIFFKINLPNFEIKISIFFITLFKSSRVISSIIFFWVKVLPPNM